MTSPQGPCPLCKAIDKGPCLSAAKQGPTKCQLGMFASRRAQICGCYREMFRLNLEALR